MEKEANNQILESAENKPGDRKQNIKVSLANNGGIISQLYHSSTPQATCCSSLQKGHSHPFLCSGLALPLPITFLSKQFTKPLQSSGPREDSLPLPLERDLGAPVCFQRVCKPCEGNDQFCLTRRPRRVRYI